MALVGDVILGAREMMTDLPQVMAPPLIASLTPTAGPNSLPPATYFVIATQLNQWGESLGSTEASITLGIANNIAVQIVGNAAATSVRIYFAAASQAQVYYLSFPLANGLGTFNINAGGVITQSPPSLSTARLPDSDGAAVGAFTLYRWLNQALSWAASKNRGGLPDFGAVGTTAGQPNYVMPGYWKKIDNAWYDGEPIGLMSKSSVFRRSPVPGFSGLLTVFQATDRLMIEAWPQPNRTSNQTTLAAPMGPADTTATLTSTSAYALGFGMTLIGAEIVNYARINGNTLTGLQRGMSGTIPASHLIGESATELNLMISGFRVPATYSVGQAISTLYLPPGWDDALISYILYRFRKAEQDDKAAAACLQEATQKMSDLSVNRIIAGPRQITPYGSSGPEVAAGLGSPFGGVIIP